MALDEYANKRSFGKTPEPAGSATASSSQTRSGVFCVQRHRARRLHYDLRLEVDGTLKSWAVPEGPSLDSAIKRLAVHVEDHPIEYGTFEGVIPPGNYGAGSVMLWDHGRYEVLGDPPAEAQLARGDFKFRLDGKKLHGDFVLVRTRQNKGRDWLLIKKKDQHAQSGWDIGLSPLSVTTGRTQEEIAAGVQAPDPSGLEQIKGAVQAPMPSMLSPMMAFARSQPPADPGWLFEVKWDGVRALCFLENGSLRMISRNGNPMDRQYPELAVLAETVRAATAILDGEIVALDERGLPGFGLLQRRMHVGDAGSAANLARTQPVTLYVFDLLYLDGWDLRRSALEDRKRLLGAILTPSGPIRLSDHFTNQGAELFHLARQSGLEGIVAKRLGSPYESRRSPNWLKIKVTQQQEFVICGYTTGERDYFSSLVLGLYDHDKLVYAGNAGSGFDQASLELVFAKLGPLVTAEMPFDTRPEMLHPPVWTRPELVCEVRFSSWTEDKRLRAPVFLGLRNDIGPKECIVETEQAVSEVQLVIPPPLVADTRDKIILTIDDRRLSFTNLNKVYYPREGYTKRDLINYYSQIADLILPYLEDRALSLRRYPDGIEGESFFQKEAAGHFPDWLRIEPIYSSHNEAPIRFVVANDRASLLFLANLGCIDQNPWMSRIGSLEHPDFLLIDLDPQDCGYDRIVEAALLVRQKLDALELAGYPKTTGGDGMHIYVPIEPVYSYEQVRSFAQILAGVLANERRDLFTTIRAVSRREKNKVYFDWAQIATGKTISAPYVLRAYPGAPVATPLEWREVRPGLTPQQFHIRNVLERFARLGDLFAPVLEAPQRLEPALQKLDSLVRR
ncbi:MAG: DNA ligase D [Acidobacteria bacterium]|nr:DNA ligase D [Acidobacteriota bacterium]